MIFVILLILVIILIITIVSDYNIEHYDVKVDKNINSSSDCGAKCTEVLQCSGFGYNNRNNSCFLSKSPILGKPLEGDYAGKYSNSDTQCNKIYNLNKKTDDKQQLLNNSIYNCVNHEDGDILDKTRQIGRNKNKKIIIDKKIEKVDNNFNGLDEDLSYDFDDTITFSKYNKKSKNLTDALNKYNVDTNYAYSNNTKNTKTNYAYSNNTQNTKTNTTKKENSFIEWDNDVLGQYMLKPQCVSNVPFYDCIKHCDNKSNCAGTEWNNSLIKKINNKDIVYENVCCPKSNITKSVTRDINNKGKFYIKTDLDYIKNRDKIHLTKADFTNKTKRETVSID